MYYLVYMRLYENNTYADCRSAININLIIINNSLHDLLISGPSDGPSIGWENHFSISLR